MPRSLTGWVLPVQKDLMSVVGLLQNPSPFFFFSVPPDRGVRPVTCVPISPFACLMPVKLGICNSIEKEKELRFQPEGGLGAVGVFWG